MSTGKDAVDWHGRGLKVWNEVQIVSDADNLGRRGGDQPHLSTISDTGACKVKTDKLIRALRTRC